MRKLFFFSLPLDTKILMRGQEIIKCCNEILTRYHEIAKSWPEILTRGDDNRPFHERKRIKRESILKIV